MDPQSARANGGNEEPGQAGVDNSQESSPRAKLQKKRPRVSSYPDSSHPAPQQKRPHGAAHGTANSKPFGAGGASASQAANPSSMPPASAESTSKAAIQQLSTSAPKGPPPPEVLVSDVVFRLRNAPCVPLQQPMEVACMTRDADRKWHYGDHSGYGTLNDNCGKRGTDLNVGFDEFERKWTPPIPDSLEHVLHALRAASFNRKPTVVAWRGILTKIMCAPFLRRDTFQIAAWKCDGVLYLSNRETPEKMAEDKNMGRRQKKFMYYGYKFEEVMTREPGHESESRDVDPANCYCRVFKTRIGDKMLVGAAEMDCCDTRRRDIELKVTRLLETPSNVRSFERFKLLKWYCQSFLSGVPLILVGFRDDEGHLRKMQFLRTLDIPKGLKEGHWDPNMCVKFLDSTLSWLMRMVPDCPKDRVNQQPVHLLETTIAGGLQLRTTDRIPDEVFEDTSIYL